MSGKSQKSETRTDLEYHRALIQEKLRTVHRNVPEGLRCSGRKPQRGGGTEVADVEVSQVMGGIVCVEGLSCTASAAAGSGEGANS